jgi:hypothetical protein
MAWVAMLSNVLTAGVSDARDRRDWGKAFTRVWCASRNGTPADRRIRLLRMEEAYCRAREIAADGQVRNPTAVFNVWLSEVGMRPAPPVKA